jgi:prepilin-type N-terminal cleavage/methylation domain-containing protein
VYAEGDPWGSLRNAARRKFILAGCQQMRLRRRRGNAEERRRQASGFSLLEMMTVVALILMMASFAFMSMIPVLKQQRVTNAYNTTMAAMRLARDSAVAKRTSYSVTFTKTGTTGTLTVAPTVTLTGDQTPATYQLPQDVTFDAETQLTTTPPPDGYGAGATEIDFGYTASGTGSGGSSVIYFCPDGSSQDAAGGAGLCAGNWSGGVVYIARPGELMSSRALTLWGATGRVRGWRLYSNGGGGYQWLRQ